jgi:hypothetical protein
MQGKPQDGDGRDSSSKYKSDLQVIVQLETNDVLMGRGSCAIRNVGNVRFRELIATRKQEYLTAGRNCTKQRIAIEILAEISRRKGRFVRQTKLEESKALGIPPGTEAWVLADTTVALEKVKQTLRDKGRSDAFDVFDSSHQLLAPSSNQVDHDRVVMQQNHDYHVHQAVSNQVQNLNLLRLEQLARPPQWTEQGMFPPSLDALDQLFPAPTGTLPRLESAWLAMALSMNPPSRLASSWSPNSSMPVAATLGDMRDHGSLALLHPPNERSSHFISNVIQSVSSAKRNTALPLEGFSKKRKV